MRRIWPIFTLFLHALPAQAALEVYFVHNDHLGTPQVITDKNQQVVWKGHMTPFGEMEVEVEKFTNHRRFPGQWYDIESGLHYNYSRYYDPSVGRYIQSDPIGLRGGLNTYAYALGNPVRHSDPRGQEAINLALCLAAIPVFQSAMDAFAPLGPIMGSEGQEIQRLNDQIRDLRKEQDLPGTSNSRRAECESEIKDLQSEIIDRAGALASEELLADPLSNIAAGFAGIGCLALSVVPGI